jgi:uncharacterized repeat protein (TIGR03803 family)
LGPDGCYYGTAYEGGANGVGSLFKVTTNGVLSSAYTFPTVAIDGLDYAYTNSTGAEPVGGLTPANGLFYGTTSLGGLYGGGSIFQYNTNGTLTVLTSLYYTATATNPISPQTALTLGNDGNLYGTSEYGGTNGEHGTIFLVTTNGAITLLYSFSDALDGEYPVAPVTLGPDGNFYGTIEEEGGTAHLGTVYEVTTNGTFTTLDSFFSTNGIAPTGPLAQGNDGRLYGTASGGGIYNHGTVFQLTTNGLLNPLIQFTGTNGAFPGLNPLGLTLGNDGAFYGVAEAGGTNNAGTVFRVTTGAGFTNLVTFNRTNGANPSAALLLGNDGYFYGLNRAGGTYNDGTVFRVDTNGLLTTLVNFTSTNGSSPEALAQGWDGNFYGAASRGGTYNDGTLFQLTTDGQFTTLVTFNYTNGAEPNSLTLGIDGNFYGTAYTGGSNGINGGTVFKLTPSGSLTTLGAFNNTNGYEPNSLITGIDGYLYGTTLGSTNGYGASFRIAPNGGLTQLFFLSNTNGGAPTALMQSGGLLYVTANQYANGNAGSILQFSPPPTTPQIDIDLTHQNLLLFSSINYDLLAYGSPPLTYKWLSNSVPVSGATDGQLTIDGTRTLNTNALYQVVITNAYGSITSSVAGLTLYVAAITGITQTTNHSMTVYCAGLPNASTRMWVFTNLVDPGADWNIIYTNTVTTTNGLWQVVDYVDTNYSAPSRFYRFTTP